MQSLPGILFLVFFLIVGVVFIIGTYCRWRWLVDPDETSWWARYDSQVILKRVLGRKFLIVFTYGLGLLFVGVTIWRLVVLCGRQV